MAISNVQVAYPGTRTENLVDLHHPSYLPKYIYEMTQGLLRPHRPKFSETVQPVTRQAQLSRQDYKNWNRFVGALGHQRPSPLTYYNSAGAFGLFELLSQMGINFSTILHLRGDMEFHNPDIKTKVGDLFTLHMHLEDVIEREGQCILVVSGTVRNDRDELIRSHRDYWFVRRCEQKYLDDCVYPKHFSAAPFKGMSKRVAELPKASGTGAEKRSFFLPPSAGHQFAKVSGDYNVIHTTTLGAKLCGQKRAFLQGYGSLNLCLHHINQTLSGDFKEFSMSFCKPVLLSQNLNLWIKDGSFELCDSEDHLLCFGSYTV
ncbi:FAS1-like dehydratase domain-containing protein [Pseudobacteriovorax antillogorgiicola]|uniref:MaoC like domain-containing protein n=1 Tax=Pseudobacteriovorax antillogorgiicola TaxID=1513793 RepID=A0A1Y6CES1_9BACT|nr:MaoC family dehydratase N-terminal domain-containing protein [Pseudobacteriovorax antillogorgiicola]TCS47571.1 MaoC dehydratase-like protein [Pseudobacteriovorax antillogorgiicola]SMF60463.1 MaoC like domain-containing protein [Pseudobacteriovorax antillogorgiicola]